MKILVLESSGNKNGSSNLLAKSLSAAQKKRAMRSRNSMCFVRTSAPASAAGTAE